MKHLGTDNLLPVRIVQPSRDFLQKEIGKPPMHFKNFIEDPEEFTTHIKYLDNKLIKITEKLNNNFLEYPDLPAIIKAKLKNEALAKTHRPTSIFDIDTCPIIGLDHMGELLISTTKPGIEKLRKRIKEPTNNKQKSNISAINDLEEYGMEDKLQGLSIHDLKMKSMKKGRTCLKVILFDHKDSEINKTMALRFESWANKENLQINNVYKAKGLNIWRIYDASEEQIKKIAEHPSVRLLSFFPQFKIIKTRELIASQELLEYPPPQDGQNYPIVGVIDSGISDNHPFLHPWVIDRETFVPVAYQDCKHGSFVGGLICMGNQLNGGGICPDEDSIQIVDVAIIPDLDKDIISEDDLMERLNSSIPILTKKHNMRIWNMSLGLETITDDERFSTLAIFLDKLQEENNIIMVLPSGNYEDILQRKWPPQEEIGNKDRLQIPGDSVRSVTVGAIACKEKPDSIVKINQPASYSCRGPGPVFTIKPDIVNYSGNLTIDKGKINCANQGIISFDENGNIVEDIGTSYSCPLGARTLSILQNRLEDSITNTTIKALVIHKSEVPQQISESGNVSPYYGFGKPAKVDEILNCNRSEITLIFEHEIYEKHSLIYPFFWPNSLKDENKCRGKVRMTLASELPLDASYGSEYIRASLSASLQSMNKKGEYKGRLQENPKSDNFEDLYEKSLIKDGYKWKPIKRYEGTFKQIVAEDWRIKVMLLLRDGMFLNHNPIKFSLIVTLSDPDCNSDIYDEVVVGLRNINVLTNPIQLRNKIYQKIKT